MYHNPLIKHLFYREQVQCCIWTVLYMTFTSKEEMIASAKTSANTYATTYVSSVNSKPCNHVVVS